MKHRACDVEEPNPTQSMGTDYYPRAEFPDQSGDFEESFREFATDFGSDEDDREHDD